MAGVLQHLRSSTLNKRPNPASMVDGQIAINYASGSPGAFFKDTNGDLVKVGPVHVGATAPNVSPASGGTAGNSLGEQWLDTSGGTYVFKIWDGAAWRSEAGEFVNVTGDTMTGSLTMGPSANLIFEGSTDDGFETTLTVVDPTADRTITLPNISGTVVTTGDSGTVTSTMIADGTIVNGDVNASAAIVGTKISPDFGSQNVVTTGTSTAASFIPTSSTAPSNGIYLPSANQVAISTNGTGKLFVDASGRLGVGTPAPGARLSVSSADNVAATTIADFSANNGTSAIQIGYNRITQVNSTPASAYLQLGVSNKSDAIFIDGTGLVGIGTTSPSQLLSIAGSSANILLAGTSNSYTTYNVNASNVGYVGDANWIFGGSSSDFGVRATSNLVFGIGAYERARIDSSGRLLVGTSTGRNIADTAQGGIQYETTNFGGISITNNRGDASGATLAFGKQRSGSVGGNTIVQNGDGLGAILFGGADGTDLETQAARIEAVVDGTPGANDMPGRLVFSTTADGAGSPTERFTLNRVGDAVFSNTSAVYPATDNAATIGGSSNRWSAVWAANGTIQTSDQRVKTDITSATLGTDFIKALRPVSYKWLEGGKRDTGERDEDGNYIYESVPGTRTHWGFIAQEVKEIVDAAGVDFGGWVLTDKNNPDSQQALRYDQFIAPLTKALQEAMERIETLEAKVAALEA